MNNKIIIEFGFRIIWSIMEISEVLSAFGGLQGFQMTDAQPKETKDLGDQNVVYVQEWEKPYPKGHDLALSPVSCF